MRWNKGDERRTIYPPIERRILPYMRGDLWATERQRIAQQNEADRDAWERGLLDQGWAPEERS